MVIETASQCTVSYTHPKNNIPYHEKLYNYLRQQQQKIYWFAKRKPYYYRHS